MTETNDKQISFVAAAEEVEEWDRRADQQDLSRSEWARQKIRTGMRLWDATGDFKHAQFDQLLKDGQASTSETRDGISGESQVKELIKRNLSTTDPIPQAELQDVLIDVMNDALYELQQEGEIEHVPGDGYRQLTNHE
jgi:hypothetical protein